MACRRGPRAEWFEWWPDAPKSNTFASQSKMTVSGCPPIGGLVSRSDLVSQLPRSGLPLFIRGKIVSSMYGDAREAERRWNCCFRFTLGKELPGGRSRDMPERAMGVLVADDEMPARRRLLDLLRQEPGITSVWEATDGQMTVDLIHSCQPDLLFLDVKMPELD